MLKHYQERVKHFFFLLLGRKKGKSTGALYALLSLKQTLLTIESGMHDLLMDYIIPKIINSYSEAKLNGRNTDM